MVLHSASAAPASPCGIARNHVKFKIGIRGDTVPIARNSNQVVVVISYIVPRCYAADDRICSIVGHIPDLSQADVDFLGALVQAECDIFRLEFPMVSRNQQRN